jgi:hypothetical protein
MKELGSQEAFARGQMISLNWHFERIARDSAQLHADAQLSTKISRLGTEFKIARLWIAT